MRFALDPAFITTKPQRLRHQEMTARQLALGFLAAVAIIVYATEMFPRYEIATGGAGDPIFILDRVSGNVAECRPLHAFSQPGSCDFIRTFSQR